MAAWEPQPEGLHTIVQLLTEFRQPGANQAQIFARLEQCSAVPDFNNYLAYVLSRATTQPLEVRQSAGLLLKNNVRRGWSSLTPAVQAYVKESLLPCMGIPERYVRITVGTAISAIVAGGSLKAWPELVFAIVQALDSGDVNAADGALDALYKVCEEVPMQVDEDVPGLPARPAALLVPRLLTLFGSPHVQLRKRAMGSVNLLLGYMPGALVFELDRYVQSLVALAHDGDSDVRKLVCQGFVGLMQTAPERLESCLRQVVEYMLARNQEPDLDVALESCEFWCAYCEAELSPDYYQVLREFIPQLIPVLLTNMAYAEDDEEVIAAEEEELRGDRPDRDQDVKPFAHHSRLMGGGGAEEGGDEGEDDDDDDEVNAWNLRKSSATSLDVLSTLFPEELLPVLLPIVQARLAQPEWRLRESAILALGAVAEGCSAGLVGMAPQIVQALLPVLADPRPLVRSIACWTLGRYCKWLFPRDVQAAPLQALQAELLDGLLKRVLDRSKPVQAAACCALAVLEEEAGEALVPRLQPILQHLIAALGTYHRRNMRHAYDALLTLASSVHTALAEPTILPLFLPQLLAKWQALGDDREQLQLLETLTAVIPCLGVAFQPYAAPVFQRCMAMAQQQLQYKQAGESAGPEYEPEFLVCALDVVSGMVEGLGTSMESLAEQAQLRELVFVACADESEDVRQSGFALMGDLAKACPSHLTPMLRRCFEACCTTLQNEAQSAAQGDAAGPSFSRAATNACWSIGELALRAPAEELATFTPDLMRCVGAVLAARLGVSKGMLENAGISLGRLALRCPQQMAPALQTFVQPWCLALRRVRDGVEKEQAYAGLCTLVQLNPMCALPSFVPMANAFASWRALNNQELRRQMAEILRGYETHLPAEQWQAAWDALEPTVQQKLRAAFM